MTSGGQTVLDSVWTLGSGEREREIERIRERERERERERQLWEKGKAQQFWVNNRKNLRN